MHGVWSLPAAGGSIYLQGGKRAFDLIAALCFAPLWCPVVACLWALSWLEAGQGFYRETRIGRHGQPFRCLKIRTMQPGLPRTCAAVKPVRDPRVTPLGRFLRRSSLDEVPQLIHVLIGQMSLVGPRPVPALELARYGRAQSAYLALRPGLTGLWQVSGRNALPYTRRIALDRSYAQEVSLPADLRILVATLREIWRMSGR